MARFMERNGATSFLVHHAVLALGASHQALHGFIDFGHGDVRLIAARGEQRSFIHEVHEVAPVMPLVSFAMRGRSTSGQ